MQNVSFIQILRANVPITQQLQTSHYFRFKDAYSVSSWLTRFQSMALVTHGFDSNRT